MADLALYKIVAAEEWRRAEAAGQFEGSEIDRRDGFIHLSSASQVRETADRHFAGLAGLLLVAVDETRLPVRWEPSRGGALFPHLYAPLPMTAVLWQRPLARGPGGAHLFPPELAGAGASGVE
jgi:uncharacterized protein (DUF952 family)